MSQIPRDAASNAFCKTMNSRQNFISNVILKMKVAMPDRTNDHVSTITQK
jgi:hypothetical protein